MKQRACMLAIHTYIYVWPLVLGTACHHHHAVVVIPREAEAEGTGGGGGGDPAGPEAHREDEA